MAIAIGNIVVAVLFVLMGLGAFARPARFLAPLGLPAQTVDARNEVQAVYGGFGLAMGGVLLAPVWLPALGQGPAIVVGVALAGMAFGRIVAAIREGIGKVPALFIGVEAIGAAALFASL